MLKEVYNNKRKNPAKIFRSLKIKAKSPKNKYDLILILCPPWGLSSPPLGPSYLSSFLSSEGYKTKILDLNIILYNKSKYMQKYWKYNFKEKWLDESSFRFLYDKFSEEIEKFISEIIATKCDLIGFSAYQNNIKMILEIASKIKKINSHIKIVVGGPSCSIERERKIFFQSFIDFIVMGEGEETLDELLKHLKNKYKKQTLSKIPGLMMVSTNKSSEFIERPPFDIKKMTNYRNDIELIKKYNNHIHPQNVSLFMSKGCIGRCTFCNDRRLMGKYRIRPAEQVIDEIKYYAKNNILNFSFNDLLINGNIKELEKLCDFIIADNLKIYWVANALASKNLTLKRLRKVRKAGCSALIFGIESGSNKILKNMKKLITIENAERVLRDCKKVGIETWINLIVGYPTESEDDFKGTLKFIERNAQYIDKILSANMCCVVYNSDLMLNRTKYGIELGDNKDISEMMWYTKNGKNTIQIRKRRLGILLKTAKDIRLPIEQTNFSIINNYIKKFVAL